MSGSVGGGMGIDGSEWEWVRVDESGWKWMGARFGTTRFSRKLTRWHLTASQQINFFTDNIQRF